MRRSPRVLLLLSVGRCKNARHQEVGDLDKSHSCQYILFLPRMTYKRSARRLTAVVCAQQVAGLIVTALERGSDRLLQHLIGPGQLIHWLTSAPEHVMPLPRATDSYAGTHHLSALATHFALFYAYSDKGGEVPARALEITWQSTCNNIDWQLT